MSYPCSDPSSSHKFQAPLESQYKKTSQEQLYNVRIVKW
jgi:hypothetical protein